MKRVAIIGAGALGRVLAENLYDKLHDRYEITGILARTPATALAEQIGCRAYESISDLLEEQPDYVVEIAGIAAVAENGIKILRAGIDLIIVSVGALANAELYASLVTAAEESGSRIYIASGAIGGFDLMRTFAIMGPMTAEIENTKAPENLEGAPYLSGRLLTQRDEATIFEGSVEDAIHGFPKNVNVAVATDLAVNCDTKVTIRSIPNLSWNNHVIRLHSRTAEAEITIRSMPDPKNPKSSTFTAWSVIALLDNLDSPVQFF